MEGSGDHEREIGGCNVQFRCFAKTQSASAGALGDVINLWMSPKAH